MIGREESVHTGKSYMLLKDCTLGEEIACLQEKLSKDLSKITKKYRRLEKELNGITQLFEFSKERYHSLEREFHLLNEECNTLLQTVSSSSKSLAQSDEYVYERECVNMPGFAVYYQDPNSQRITYSQFIKVAKIKSDQREDLKVFATGVAASLAARKEWAKPVDGRHMRTESASLKSDSGHAKLKPIPLVNRSDGQASMPSASVQVGTFKPIEGQKQMDESDIG